MSAAAKSPPVPKAPLAARREALLKECALQRLALSAEAKNLLMPLAPANLRHAFGARLKVPLMLAGAGLGLMLARPKRVVALLPAAQSVWRNVSKVLPLVSGVAARIVR
ncbi:MAG TPA: hypothetical protein VGP06_09510 [Janthinobacterium sp.]|jgi:hypothetical protein|nr:hypothetical protein [Janthinobacterium sp.]